MSSIDVSVLIVNYNSGELTQNCINSVFNYTKGLSFEVIVVDNASMDNSVDVLEKDNRITFVKSESNLGFGRANNLAFDYTKGKYIFLLNPDAELKNNAIKFFYDSMEGFPNKVGCIGAVLKNPEGNPTHSFGAFPNMIRSLGYANVKNEECMSQIEKGSFVVDYITGANLFIRKEVINKLGFFDADFFLYYEETELQYRYNKEGFCSRIVFGPEIVHVGGAITKSDSFQRRYIVTKSTLLYFKKTTSRLKYEVFKFLLFFRRLPMSLLRKDSLKDKYQYFKLLITGQ